MVEQVAEQRNLQAKLDSLKTSTVEPRLPTEDEVMAYVVDVEARIKDDPTTAREALRRLLLNGKIIMHPQPDGSWRGESAVLPLRLAGTRKPRSGGPTGASGIATNKVEIGSCAGAQLDFPDPQIAEGDECWIPFDKTIAVGWE